MTVTVRTVLLDDPRPLLAIAAELPAAHRSVFVREGDGLVTAGELAAVPVPAGEGRLTAARAGLDALLADATVHDPVRLPGSGAVAVGSFTFDASTPGSVLRVPRVVVGRRDGVTWRTDLALPGEDMPDAYATDGTTATAGTATGRPDATSTATAEVDRPRYAGSTLDDAAWLEAVAGTIAAIRGGAFEKVVLARDVRLWSRSPFAIDDVLDRLAARFPSCFTFLVDGLVGASPELLLRRRGAAVSSRVLAGTAPRGHDAADDARIGAELLASAKDRWEHDLAATSVTDVLGRFCADVVAPDGPSLVRLDNVQHLGSDVTGTLAGDVHVLDMLDALHPTAAVAGTPRDAAVAHIRGVEGMDRGRYAGPVGWCDADGDGEFAIALRCAEVDGTRARLFAGAGVVGASLPEAELMETWLKLRAMTDVLTRR